jgi:alpha-L-rhamnosidase
MRLALFFLLPGAVFAAGLDPQGLRCEYLEKPLAVEDPHPRLSWNLPSGTPLQRQSAWAIRAASSEEKLARNKPDLWDSGKTDGSDTSQIEYAGKPLKSGQQVFWQVKVWDKDGVASEWSPTSTWRVALTDPEEWVAKWISFRDETPLHTSPESLHLPPARFFRKEFEIAKPVRRATAYLSALGNAEIRFNGKPATDAFFLPGWSDYNQRAYYRAFDVTPLLKPGPNTFGAVLSDGWYAGYVGYGMLVGYGPHKTGRYMYGKTPALLTQINVEFEDGTRKVVGSDTSWKTTSDGPITEADLLMGERYDANREQRGWDQSGFPAALWEKAVTADSNKGVTAPFFDNCGEREVDLGFKKPPKLQSYTGPDVRVTEELKPAKITEPTPGVYIFDFGTNFAGNVRLKVKGAKGQTVTLRYGEMLHPDGQLMTENLRKARATDTYILRGDPEGEEWSPRFTYHGFQFCEISGLTSAPVPEMLTGLVLQSDTPRTSEFECSDEVINQLFKNIVRTQRANFLEIPTDCPQRDERLGWMGDAQIYVRSATYNADVASFFTKWLDDVEESQRPVGAYPDYAPYPMGHGERGKTFGTAWMDAGIICPHTIWKVYGDKRVIDRHWASMTRFMEFRISSSPRFSGISIGNAWGDWLNLKDPTPVELIDSAYFAHSAQLMAEMAEATGRNKEAERYREVLENVRDAFADKHLAADGTLNPPSQTACVLALQFELVPEKNRAAVGKQLVRLIERNQHRMSTGFLGTKSILPALTEIGKPSLALHLFQSREFPSWGYPVINGATSIWERWDSYTKENGFGGSNNAAMNSFSHYSFGAVCQWMFQSLAGIDTNGPGYKKILLKPLIPTQTGTEAATSLNWVKASYLSPSGLIKVEWRVDKDHYEYRTEVPTNTTATLQLPVRALESVRVNKAPMKEAKGVKTLPSAEGVSKCELQPGVYQFEIPLDSQ